MTVGPDLARRIFLFLIFCVKDSYRLGGADDRVTTQ
jgi:hypothetical protein